MGVEKEIERELARGKKPTEIIEKEGYAKSTVYKVNKRLQKGEEMHFRQPLLIQGWKWDRIRVQPGDMAVLDFTVKNTLDRDFYYTHFGVQPSWLEERDEWIGIEEGDNRLLKPSEERSFKVTFQVPDSLPLGDYSVHVAFNGGYVNQSSNRVMSERELKYPVTLNLQVKEPRTGYTVFFSHSVQDKQLCNNLRAELENKGIEVILGEERRDPGRDLEEKFAELIDSSDIFIGLLTEEALESKWVQYEVDYAYDSDMPMLLLVEESVDIDATMEYVEFSKRESVESLNSKMLDSVKKFVETENNQVPEKVMWGVAGAFIGFAAASILSD